MSVRANIEKLSWDSDFFSAPIARLTDINVATSPLLISDSFTDYKLVQAKVDANDYLGVHALQNMGFEVVDGEIDFELTTSLNCNMQDRCLQLATKEAIPALRVLASDAFTFSRFRSPWFDQQDSGRFYSEWAEKSVWGTYDHCCLILKENEDSKIKGFVTLRQLNEHEARVGLLVVNPNSRKQGVGETLVKGALSWCRAKNVSRLRIATQTGNIPAQRLYIKCGATIAHSSYWLYRLT